MLRLNGPAVAARIAATSARTSSVESIAHGSDPRPPAALTAIAERAAVGAGHRGLDDGVLDPEQLGQSRRHTDHSASPQHHGRCPMPDWSAERAGIRTLRSPISLVVRGSSVAGVGAVVQVEVYSDVVCPWCYIGKTRLDRAIAELATDADFPGVEVVYRPFQLDPQAPRDRAEPVLDVYARKFGGPRTGRSR